MKTEKTRAKLSGIKWMSTIEERLKKGKVLGPDTCKYLPGTALKSTTWPACIGCILNDWGIYFLSPPYLSGTGTDLGLGQAVGE